MISKQRRRDDDDVAGNFHDEHAPLAPAVVNGFLLRRDMVTQPSLLRFVDAALDISKPSVELADLLERTFQRGSILRLLRHHHHELAHVASQFL